MKINWCKIGLHNWKYNHKTPYHTKEESIRTCSNCGLAMVLVFDTDYYGYGRDHSWQKIESNQCKNTY
jgi:hypothetical protein